MEFRSGFVTIIGDTNAGKSTLINKIVGEKVSIVSPKSQTSRDNTIGIYNDENSQIVFTDTPGYHKIQHKLDEYMQHNIDNASGDADVLVLVIDGKKPLIEQYKKLMGSRANIRSKTILCINKIDELSFEKMYPKLAELNSVCTADEILPISALKGKNVDILIDLIKKYLPKYDYPMLYYPLEQFTDKNVRYLSAEIIREKVLLMLDDEIPHGVAVEITKFDEDENSCDISANIYCEKENHKAILLGKNGSMIKKISTASRISIEKMLDLPVYLDLFVKTRTNWRTDNLSLAELGYKITDNQE